jgi:hypothetical protein
MKLFNIFAGIMGFFGLVFLISRFFPHSYKIEKSTTINLPVEQTYAYLNDMKYWNDWSPWNKSIDSTMVLFYSQIKTGKGATQYFRGNLVGNGRFKITESIPNEKIQFHLSLNGGELAIYQTFYLKNIGGQTQLNWVDTGDVGNNPIYRFMLPSRISSQEQGFEEGLKTIKEAAVSYAKASATEGKR